MEQTSMNNNRELLEQAAKAAGLNYSHEHRDVIDDDHPYGYTWEPLEDDGDALRLAVKLGLDVRNALYTDAVYVDCFEIVGVEVEYNDDPYEATRRAIVRAAAEIGRSL
jgi:hypothetical protein